VVVIRHVQPQDLFSIIKIAYETLPEQYNSSIFTTFYETFPQGFFIAEDYHKIIGFLVGIKTSNTTAKILMLSVKKKYRKQKIGSALIQKFLQEMTYHHLQSVDLEVRTTNTIAIIFYKKHKFEIIEKLSGFYNNREDAYSMMRML
jgi:ribosomal-protein-alanine acetyltransferase